MYRDSELNDGYLGIMREQLREKIGTPEAIEKTRKYIISRIDKTADENNEIHSGDGDGTGNGAQSALPDSR